MENNNNPYYKHYLSIDWSQQDVSIARMRDQRIIRWQKKS